MAALACAGVPVLARWVCRVRGGVECAISRGKGWEVEVSAAAKGEVCWGL